MQKKKVLSFYRICCTSNTICKINKSTFQPIAFFNGEFRRLFISIYTIKLMI